MRCSNADPKRATALSVLVGELLGGQPVDLGVVTVLSKQPELRQAFEQLRQHLPRCEFEQAAQNEPCNTEHVTASGRQLAESNQEQLCLQLLLEEARQRLARGGKPQRPELAGVAENA
jgi:hypothetical protein